VACSERVSFGYRLDRFADENTVHDDGLSDGEIANRKFVFRRDVRAKQIGGARKGYRVAGSKILEGHEKVVARGELKNFGIHRLRSLGCSSLKLLHDTNP